MRAKTLTFKRARRLRREMTLPEVVLWTRVRQGRLRGLRFRRQHPMGSYILDFYCAAARLAVEVDGAGHDHPDQVRHDRARTGWLREQGVRVMRFRAADVLNDETLEGVLAEIGDVAEQRIGEAGGGVAPSTTLRAVPLPRSAGEEP